MPTLDMPQHVYVCAPCGTRLYGEGALRCEAHPLSGIRVAPTLLRADFDAYMIELVAQHGPDVPDPLVVWDRLEACTDTAPSNREAIDNAIRWVVSR